MKLTGIFSVIPEDNYQEPYSFVVDGYFIFATRQLVLEGRRPMDLGAVSVSMCYFNRGNDQADCSLLLESSELACGVYLLERAD